MTEIRHFHLFCGLGGGAAGFNRGSARVGSKLATFRCLGGVDSDPSAVADFRRLSGVDGAVLDLFDRQQYIDWHGHEPPADWRECTPADLRRAAGDERPHIVFTSPPCKGLSGLLPETKAKTRKYRALNRLTLRGVQLALEAWSDDPVEFFLLENVPQIAGGRGRHFLDQIRGLLEGYGYAVAEAMHNCGELGGLAQSRRRFLLVARHQEKVPPFLYEPPVRQMRGVGEILERLPAPGDTVLGGPMHRIPHLQWQTWVRLAFVEPGGDWRSLERLSVDDRSGMLDSHALIPDGNLGSGSFRVASGCGGLSVPLRQGGNFSGQVGVIPWDAPSGAIAGESFPSNGRFSVADPRLPPSENRHKSVLRVCHWDKASGTITGDFRVNGGGGVADPRTLKIPSIAPFERLPKPRATGVWRIIAEDNTWHRPLTTLELAALQSLIDPDDPLCLDGASDTAWRERIGNAVPADAAAAIASVMGTALLLAWSGQTFALGSTPIWVRPLAIAASVASVASA